MAKCDTVKMLHCDTSNRMQASSPQGYPWAQVGWADPPHGPWSPPPRPGPSAQQRHPCQQALIAQPPEPHHLGFSATIRAFINTLTKHTSLTKHRRRLPGSFGSRQNPIRLQILLVLPFLAPQGGRRLKADPCKTVSEQFDMTSCITAITAWIVAMGA